jgi:hypothetical protein
MTTLSDRIRWNLETKVYLHLGPWDPRLKFPHSIFEGFRDSELRRIARMLARTRYADPLPGVAGWSSPREKQLLYAFGRWLPGPFLEIGPWVGKSTCCIASGIRDSGGNSSCRRNSTRQQRTFDLWRTESVLLSSGFADEHGHMHAAGIRRRDQTSHNESGVG